MKVVAAFTALALIAAPSIAGDKCRDAKGKFTKCPPAAATNATNVVKDAKGKCHVASGPNKGKFAKCP